MGRLKFTLTSISAVAVFAGVGLIQAGAASAADTITITNVGSPAYTNIGQLSVTVVADTPLTNLDVQLLTADNSLALDLPFGDFTATGTGVNGNGIYTVTTPITTSQLPLGTYAVSITAADTGGGSLTSDNIGNWSFVNEPQLTLGASPSVLDYGHQSITMSGTATVLATDETSSALANWPLSLSYQGADGQVHSVNVSTDASGNFQATVSNLLPAASTLTATVAATNTMGAGSSQFSLGFTTDSVTVTERLSPASVNYGKSTTVAGTATYRSAGLGSVPLAHSKVSVSSSRPGSTPVSVSTNASGQYKFVTPRQKAGATWTVRSPATSYLDAAKASKSLTVNLPSRITRFTGSLSSFGRLTFNACLNVTVPKPHSVAGQITYQWSRNAHGPWRNLRVARPTASAHCPGIGRSEKASVNAPVPNGYYRAIRPGGDGFEFSASPTLHLWKYLTRITGFTLSPHRARHNGNITVSGRLSERVGSWRGLAGEHIKVAFACDDQGDSPVWVFRRSMTTDSSGYFSAPYPLQCTGPWLTLFKGNSTHFASLSSVIQMTQTSASAAVAVRPTGSNVGASAAMAHGAVMPEVVTGALSVESVNRVVDLVVHRLGTELRQLP